MRYCVTNLCQECICRRIADTEEIVEVLSDPHNHADKRRQLIELLGERRRLREEAAKMGLA